MSKISDIISKMDAFSSITPAKVSDIELAQQKLNLRFSDDYKECLLKFGQFSIYGHEFTGITTTSRLDVVAVTQEEKAFNQSISDDLYVIEQTHYDDIVICQNQRGEVFTSSPFASTQKIANSLLEYIALDDE